MGGSREDNFSRFGQARTAVRQLNALLWGTKIINNIKIRLYKALVQRTCDAKAWEISLNCTLTRRISGGLQDTYGGEWELI